MFRFALAVLLASASPLFPQAPAAPDIQREKASAHFGFKREHLSRKPDVDLGVVRVWNLEKTEKVSSLLVELRGTLPNHYHPDGVHRTYVLEGKIRIASGGGPGEPPAVERVLGPGDYVMIPMGLPHRLVSLGRRALYGTVDTPPVDPARIVWLEPPPSGVVRPPDADCRSDSDCVPARCCHPTACVPKSQNPDCKGMFCTQDCRPGTLDCGGRCACEDARCVALDAEGVALGKK